jgi:hypothetical protein
VQASLLYVTAGLIGVVYIFSKDTSSTLQNSVDSS